MDRAAKTLDVWIWVKKCDAPSRLGIRPLGDGRTPILEPNTTTTVTQHVDVCACESTLQKEQMDRGIGVPPTVKMRPRTSSDGRFMEPQAAWDMGTSAVLQRRSTKHRCGGGAAAEPSREGTWRGRGTPPHDLDHAWSGRGPLATLEVADPWQHGSLATRVAVDP
jgi:hypothetical protein